MDPKKRTEDRAQSQHADLCNTGRYPDDSGLPLASKQSDLRGLKRFGQRASAPNYNPQQYFERMEAWSFETAFYLLVDSCLRFDAFYVDA